MAADADTCTLDDDATEGEAIPWSGAEVPAQQDDEDEEGDDE